jgi:hypothetical protein
MYRDSIPCKLVSFYRRSGPIRTCPTIFLCGQAAENSAQAEDERLNFSGQEFHVQHFMELS